MNKPIHIAIVDDHPLFREGVVSALQREAEFEVVGEGSTSEEAVNLAHTLQPDIMILDYGIMGGGIKTIETVKSVAPNTRIVMLTVLTDRTQVTATFHAGVSAFVLKGVGGRELNNIIHKVVSGEGYVTPSLAAEILSTPEAIAITATDTAAHRHSVKNLDVLSEREQVILQLITSGLSNREIGEQIHLSEKTVKHYVTVILQKLHVRNRVEAAAFGRSLDNTSAT